MTLEEINAKYGRPTPTNATSSLASRWAGATEAKPNIEENKATFVATGNENPAMAALKTVGNIPESAVHFGKSVIDFLNPLNTVKTAQNLGESLGDTTQPKVSVGAVAKEIPNEAYKALVPQFLQHIFSGDLKSAAATLENDPVGQIAPLLLVARGAAEKLGRGAEFDSAMTKISNPVTEPVTKGAKAIGRGTKALAEQTAGMSTGAGASSIQEAFKAGRTGGTQLEAFTKALRGESSPEEIVQSAQDIVGTIKENRGNSYVEQLKKIGEDKTSHEITPIIDELNNQLKKFNIKEVAKDGKTELDFSRSSIANNGTARADVQGVYDTVKDWGSQAGDRTGVGLDTLKKQLSDFYSPSSQARAFVQGVKSPVQNILNNIPGYKEMTASYAKASDFVDEIKSATGAGANAKPDTVFTKLTTAMKGDKDFRLEVMNEMTKTDPDFMAKIAGSNLSSWIPRGLVGRGTDIGVAANILFSSFNPQVIPLLLSTSPRIVGEFVRALGMGTAKTAQVIDALKTFNRTGQGKTDNMGMSIYDVSKQDSNTAPQNVKAKNSSIESKVAQPKPSVKGLKGEGEIPKTMDIPKDLESLAVEARKYKSAEEFVSSQTKEISAKAMAENQTVKKYNYERTSLPIKDIKEFETVDTKSPKFLEIKKSVSRGDRTPIIVDERNRIIDGHHRFNAYKESGANYGSVPVLKAIGEGTGKIVRDVNYYDPKIKGSLTDFYNKAVK